MKPDFNSKNLKRLFPTDQSMVVVIDDRADVWGDVPNLVKVIPCKWHCLRYGSIADDADEFFVGTGDVNGAFLPPSSANPLNGAGASTRATSPASTASTPPPMTPTDDDSTSARDLATQAKELNAVSQGRPLARLQDQLDQEAASGASSASPENVVNVDSTDVANRPANDGKKAPIRPVLKASDDELDRISRVR